MQVIAFIQIYINLKVGSTKQNIPFYLYLQQYPLVLQSSNAKKGEIKGIYDENKSDKYRKISEEKEFISGDLVKGILSEDIFEINSNPSIIKFYLSVENYKEKTMKNRYSDGIVTQQALAARDSIAQQLRDTRHSQGLTQEVLAERAGTRKSNISRMESGKYNPSLDFLVKVAG